jgi:hypothetical protein
VKFLSPAGVTPVLAPQPAASSVAVATSTPNPALPLPPLLAGALRQRSPPFMPPPPSRCSTAAGGGGVFSSPVQSATTGTPQTPFRTPKSVLRKPGEQRAESRILGTPDYLAPELLLRQGTVKSRYLFLRLLHNYSGSRSSLVLRADSDLAVLAKPSYGTT